MKELSLKEIQDIELDMLVKFAKFCQENKLHFYLCGGTLLGAIRHQGFIPWDDDIDVCMPRPDYDRLINNCSLKLSNISLFSSENGNLMVPFAKLKRIDTKVVSENCRSNIDDKIWIDIFPVDGLPEAVSNQKKLYRKAYILRALLTLSQGQLLGCSSFFLKIIKRIICPFAYLIGGKRFCLWLNSLSRKISYEKSEYVGCITWGLHGVPGEVMRRAEFEKCKTAIFCDIKFPIFSCWKEYLSGCYGDYMLIPDEKKRQTHKIRAYILD